MYNIHTETLYRGNVGDTANFRCSDEPIVEEFLKEDALELQEQDMVVTKLVYSLQGNLLGYYSLFASNIPKLGRDKIAKEGWDVPQNEKYYPSIRLHYLGVDERVRGKGVGTQIWLSALNDIVEIKRLVGCSFITVESLNSAIGFYEKLGFVNIGRQYNIMNMVYKLRTLK